MTDSTSSYLNGKVCMRQGHAESESGSRFLPTGTDQPAADLLKRRA